MNLAYYWLVRSAATAESREQIDAQLYAPIPGRTRRADPEAELAEFLSVTSGL